MVMSRQLVIMWVSQFYPIFIIFSAYCFFGILGYFICQEFGLPMAWWLEATVGTLTPRTSPTSCSSTLMTTSSEIMTFEIFGKLPRLWDFLNLRFSRLVRS